MKLTSQLRERGYDYILINKIFNMVFNLDRDKLINYKEKSSKENDKIYFKMLFDRNSFKFKEIFNKVFKDFKLKYPEFEKLKFTFVNKMQFNLSSLLVHNFKFPDSFKNNYKKCEDLNCKICIFSNSDFKILVKDQFFLPIWNFSSCDSLNCIYIIKCKLCNFFYIGQTNCIKKRIYKHLYDIKNFVPFEKNNTSVSIHFNLKYHIYQKHFSFFIYRNNLENLNQRLNLESFLINLFLKMKVNLINDCIPNMKTIYND